MTDEIDRAEELYSFEFDMKIASIRKNASEIPVGEPGDCSSCGNSFSRLVNGVCGRCRDINNRVLGSFRR